MRNEHKPLFSEDNPPLPAGLRQAILGRVARARSYARARLNILLGVSLASFVGVVGLVQEFAHETQQSGVREIGSLLFSDTGTVIAFWQDFLFSLAESFPTVSALAALSGTFVLLWALYASRHDMTLLWRTSHITRS